MASPARPRAAWEPFPSTRWSRIRPGGEGGTARALDTLARGYAAPIEAFLRAALGRRADDAGDLAQGFFVWVIESGFLARADPERGSFRAFLKTALRHYVADADRRGRRLKRGGGAKTVELADADAAAPGSPEAELDAAWRAELVRSALKRTREQLEREGRAVVFAVFRDYFLEESKELDYRAVAARHGVSVVDVSNHLMRAKRAFRAHLRALVLDTVRSLDELERELAWLVGHEPR